MFPKYISYNSLPRFHAFVATLFIPLKTSITLNTLSEDTSQIWCGEKL